MEPMQWEIDIPVLRNRLFKRYIAKVFSVCYLALFLPVLLFTGFDPRLVQAALVVAGAAILVFLLCAPFLRGRFLACYNLDASGVSQGLRQVWNDPKEEGWAKFFIKDALFLSAGGWVAYGRPSGGLFAMEKEVLHLSWDRVLKVVSVPSRRLILLKGDPRPTLAIYCPESNLGQIQASVRAMTAGRTFAVKGEPGGKTPSPSGGETSEKQDRDPRHRQRRAGHVADAEFLPEVQDGNRQDQDRHRRLQR